MKDFLNTLINVIKENPILMFMLCLGCMSPGILAIVLFEWKVFLEIEIIKILVLGCSLTIPSINVLFLFVRIHEKHKETSNVQDDFIVSLAFNAVVWGIALLFKVFDMEISVKEFVNLLIFEVLVASCTLWIDYKKTLSKEEGEIVNMKKKNSA